jgi:hypothetical protein
VGNFGALQAGRPLNLLSAPPTSPVSCTQIVTTSSISTIRPTDWYLWYKLPSIQSLEACIQSLGYFQYGSQRVSAEAAQCLSKSAAGVCNCIRSLIDEKALKEQNLQQRRLALVMKLLGSNPSQSSCKTSSTKLKPRTMAQSAKRGAKARIASITSTFLVVHYRYIEPYPKLSS